jgi:phage shock protein E
MKASPMPAITLFATLSAGFTFCLLAQTQAPQAPAPRPTLTPEARRASSALSVNGLPIQNDQINYPQFLADAKKVEGLRNERRVTEERFMEMAAEPGTVVLDARSADKFAMIHVKGAVNLPLTDFTAEDLAKVIPAKDTRILIYCNNNFQEDEVALAYKIPPASLNIYTFNSLYAYGYENVFELGPVIKVPAAKLPMEGPRAPKATLKKAY